MLSDFLERNDDKALGRVLALYEFLSYYRNDSIAGILNGFKELQPNQDDLTRALQELNDSSIIAPAEVQVEKLKAVRSLTGFGEVVYMTTEDIEKLLSVIEEEVRVCVTNLIFRGDIETAIAIATKIENPDFHDLTLSEVLAYLRLNGYNMSHEDFLPIIRTGLDETQLEIYVQLSIAGSKLRGNEQVEAERVLDNILPTVAELQCQRFRDKVYARIADCYLKIDYLIDKAQKVVDQIQDEGIKDKYLSMIVQKLLVYKNFDEARLVCKKISNTRTRGDALQALIAKIISSSRFIENLAYVLEIAFEIDEEEQHIQSLKTIVKAINAYYRRHPTETGLFGTYKKLIEWFPKLRARLGARKFDDFLEYVLEDFFNSGFQVPNYRIKEGFAAVLF